ncbi:hypothetical protein [Luteimonas terrae]|uniref:Uncharacterized protein n=1 Tax=Luteimonas terrae TaxID=1530191 RepID=A0ABU1XYR8_9GAMM|nr:hypothetical protein [Luteimonas terrae]MDR7193355.1 hypothetical protein [Luteimonas terrae]
MAVFPPDVHILFQGFGEAFDPSVERTEMERGLPKQRVLNSQVLMQVNATLLFSSKASAVGFEDWYFDTIKRIGEFDFVHPRTGTTHRGRFRGGNIGTLVPRNPRYTRSTRDVVLEYLR